ncbi:MAG: B12-binding domain-containing radical SAM protein [Acidobacteriota bacterium]
MNAGKLIVLTAPLTEMIDHAGYFIQMAVASLPTWMEGYINRKYPEWRNVKRFDDGSAQTAPAGLRILELVLQREFGMENVVVCYPQDLDRFIGPATRTVAVTTMNPMGVTFAAGVYASIFGSSKQPINGKYAELMFEAIKASHHRNHFKVLVGGSGGWQISHTDSFERFGVDCIIEGRSESAETIELFRKAVSDAELPQKVNVSHPMDPDAIIFPKKPTIFGVVEMTTGCGRRCKFCMPDLNPQIDLPKHKIMEAVRANVENGNHQISLVTEDLFIWGQVRTDTPFFFPNREALVDLFSDVANYPGVEQFALSHSTMAPAVVDPELIRRLSETLLEKSPIHFPSVSSHPEGKALAPLIGLETGSVRMAKKIMAGKAVPFSVEDWPSVMIRGLETLNRNNWFPMLTLIVGAPGEADEDVKATLDLIFEMERRGLHGFLIPSVFTPLEGTSMESAEGVLRTRDLTPLQWQLIMKCWKMNMRHGLYSWWGPMAFRIGGLLVWLVKLRRTNGPNFKWPMMMFCNALPEKWMVRAGKLYGGKPLQIKTRAELLASIRPKWWQHLREDTGDIPAELPEVVLQPRAREDSISVTA